MRKNIITVYPEVYGVICLVLMLLPLKLVIAWGLSVFFHELSHWIAIKLTGGHVSRICIKFSGIQMFTSPLSNFQELVCAAAGPIGSLLLFVLCYKYVPLLGVFSLIHSLYNFIPLFPLDGGRIIHSLIAIVFKGHYLNEFSNAFDCTVSALLIIAVIFATFRFTIGPIPLIMVIIMIFNNKKLKYS